MDTIEQIAANNEHFIDPIPEIEPPADLSEQRKSAKKAFSRIGLVIGLVFVGVTILSVVLSTTLTGLNIVDKETADSYTYQLLVRTLPICVIGYPLMYLLLRKLPAQRPEKGEFKVRHEIMFFIIALSSMFIGNIISATASLLMSRGQSTNQVAEVSPLGHRTGGTQDVDRNKNMW